VTLQEHLNRVASGDISPRVVCHDRGRAPRDWLYVAWTPVWEGPARPDYQAAQADLSERLAATVSVSRAEPR
jgi:hypothetical protein